MDFPHISSPVFWPKAFLPQLPSLGSFKQALMNNLPFGGGQQEELIDHYFTLMMDSDSSEKEDIALNSWVRKILGLAKKECDLDATMKMLEPKELVNKIGAFNSMILLSNGILASSALANMREGKDKQPAQAVARLFQESLKDLTSHYHPEEFLRDNISCKFNRKDVTAEFMTELLKEEREALKRAVTRMSLTCFTAGVGYTGVATLWPFEAKQIINVQNAAEVIQKVVQPPTILTSASSNGTNPSIVSTPDVFTEMGLDLLNPWVQTAATVVIVAAVLLAQHRNKGTADSSEEDKEIGATREGSPSVNLGSATTPPETTPISEPAPTKPQQNNPLIDDATSDDPLATGNSGTLPQTPGNNAPDSSGIEARKLEVIVQPTVVPAEKQNANSTILGTLSTGGNKALSVVKQIFKLGAEKQERKTKKEKKEKKSKKEKIERVSPSKPSEKIESKLDKLDGTERKAWMAVFVDFFSSKKMYEKEGVLRVPADTNKVNEFLKKVFSEASEPSKDCPSPFALSLSKQMKNLFEDATGFESKVDAIGQVLKKFIGTCNLLEDDVLEAFIEAGESDAIKTEGGMTIWKLKDENFTKDKLRNDVLSKMPKEKKDLFASLMQILWKLKDHSKTNQMTSIALGGCGIGASLTNKIQDDRLPLVRSNANPALEYIIEHKDEFEDLLFVKNASEEANAPETMAIIPFDQ